MQTSSVAEPLIVAGEHLPPEAANRILQQGRAVVPRLLEIFEKGESGPLQGGPVPMGWAPAHAAELLSKLAAAEAIEPMLRVLSSARPEDPLSAVLVDALAAMGPAALEPVLRAHAASTEPAYRDALCTVLTRLGTRDDRILDALLALLARERGLGAAFLAEYGDSRALPHLSRALDGCEIDDHGGWLANMEAVELRAAIEDLGGALTPTQRERLARAWPDPPRRDLD